MNEEDINKLEEIILDVDLKLNVLRSAVKDSDYGALEMCAVSFCVEDIYNTLQQVRKIF